jgi:Domain of unknown function (DUF4465)/PEP-CTERM motif
MHRWILPILFLLTPAAASADFTSTFEDQGLPANSFQNNAGASGQFTSGGNGFNNTFDPSFGGIWSGWSISSTTDTTTPGFGNQYSAITGSGANGSQTYGVAFTFSTGVDPLHPDGSIINLAAGSSPQSIDVTNTTYAYLSMLNGDSFARKFAAGDFFQLTISGYDSLNGTGNIVAEKDFYLADFLNGNHLIVNTWQTLDLTSLAGAKSLRFGLKSSDNDPSFGMNTPAFFAVDNFTAAVPEPSTGLLVLIGLGVARTVRRRGRRQASSH